MAEQGNQRWNGGHDSYRLPQEVIRTTDYDVVPLAEDSVAKAFVLAHHYSGCYPAARFRFGLYRHGELAGVAVFSHPCNDRVLTAVFPGDVHMSVELGRFVLLDNVPGNGETWFLARCFDGLRQRGITGVVSFSDPVPRTSTDGARVFPGHIGTIYQAHNAAYLGRGTARSLRLLPDGRVFSDRSIQKIRAGERGWTYAVRQLTDWGIRAPACLDYEPDLEELKAWLQQAMRITRSVRHPGNHKYAWGLNRRVKVYSVAAYPKVKDVA